MAGRTPVSKRVRFEVFKRDKFKCQYCGRAAPEAVLHVDHIAPVANGGGNEITNLVAACQECNGGKGAVRLDDNSAVEKMRDQLEELQERREQLELMMEWKRGLDKLDSDMLGKVVQFCNEKIEPFQLSDTGKKNIARLLKKYSLECVFEAIRKSADQYIVIRDDSKPSGESVDLMLSKIAGFCFSMNLPEREKNARYVRGIIKRRFEDKINGWSVQRANIELAFMLDQILVAMSEGISFEKLKMEACFCNSYRHFEDYLRKICDGDISKEELEQVTSS